MAPALLPNIPLRINDYSREPSMSLTEAWRTMPNRERYSPPE
jgi:hypothetical protein